jgi:hypothetical protein
MSTIDNFPENVLLDIFDFYRMTHTLPKSPCTTWAWHVLVHVCRKWRQLVFTSPRRLGLRVCCTPVTPVRKMLDIWPPSLPITIHNMGMKDPLMGPDPDEDDNMIAALERRDRVCAIDLAFILRFSHRQLERVMAAMQEPFPLLTHLYLGSPHLYSDLYSVSNEEMARTLPAKFMGGSAPRLQRLKLHGINAFPALPNLVLSPEALTTIEFNDIPSTAYISPEAMVAFLSTLTRLERLIIQFRSQISPPTTPTSQRVAIPFTRAVLPALACFRFSGASGYLEDMLARIDAPILSSVEFVS